jgi:carboxylesterase
VTAAILPGAEPGSWTSDSSVGVLTLHGFTGNCSSMRPLAEAFAAKGWNVELPLLPGHGTSVDDMIATGWADWSAAAEQAYHRLASRCSKVVVSGLSMGGALTLWLAGRHADLAGIICVNPATQPQPDEVVQMLQGMVDEGQDRMPAIGGDIADPSQQEIGYDATPLAALISLMGALEDLQRVYPNTCHPLLLCSSPQDHVVPPEQGDHLASAWAGPVERVILERSYHVATQDYDAPLIIERSIAFIERVTA